MESTDETKKNEEETEQKTENVRESRVERAETRASNGEKAGGMCGVRRGFGRKKGMSMRWKTERTQVVEQKTRQEKEKRRQR